MVYPVFAHVCAGSNVIPAVAGVWRFKQLGRPMKIMAVLAVLACVQLGVELVVAQLLHYNNFLADYYGFVELSLLLGTYFAFLRSENTRFVPLTLGIIYAVVWVVMVPYSDNPEVVSSNLAVISRIFLVAGSLVTLNAVVNVESRRVVDTPVFWVVMGVLLYSAGTLMVVGFGTRLLKMGLPYFELAWRINWTLTIAANLLYTRGFLCKDQQ